MLATRGDPVFPLVFVWAAFAIRTGHADTPLVADTATVLAAMVFVADVAGFAFMQYRSHLATASSIGAVSSKTSIEDGAASSLLSAAE